MRIKKDYDVSMMKITLKKATPKDIPDLLEIDSKAFNRDFDNHFTEKELKEIFHKKGENGFIIADGKRVGYYSFMKTGVNRAEIITLAVIPEHQRKKIGTESLEIIMQKLKGYGKIKIVTHPRNTVALILYIKKGFVVTGYSKEHYGPGQDRVVLEYRR